MDALSLRSAQDDITKTCAIGSAIADQFRGGHNDAAFNAYRDEILMELDEAVAENDVCRAITAVWLYALVVGRPTGSGATPPG